MKSSANKVKAPISKQAVKQILRANQEVKQLANFLVGGVPISTGGTIFPLTPIPQGDGINNRSGNAVILKDMRLQVTAFQPVVATSNTFRIMVFMDSMASGAAPTVGDVLEQVSFTSPLNANNRQRNRFKILCDVTKTLVGGTIYQEVTEVCQMKLKGTRYFNDASGAVSNSGRNSLFFLVIGAANTGTFAYQFCVRYTDS